MENNALLYPLLALSRLRMDVDGNGVTTLVAGAGCPLACRFCINAKLLSEKRPELITAEELFRRTRIDDLYFQSTCGGLCFGGGESLLHADFIASFRKLIGSVWRITAETSLNVDERSVRIAVDCVDEFIVDIKTADRDIYKKYTGGDNTVVFDNLKILSELADRDRVKIRIPLIPEYNTSDDVKKSTQIVKSMGFSRIEAFEYIIR